MKKVELVGMVIGRLTVIKEAGRRNGKILWSCICSCGKNINAASGDLRSGNTKSCGCLRKEITATIRKKHGMCRTRTYATWSGMISRCENKNNEAYDRYGGRGVFICKEWRESFECFLHDMGVAPEGLTIERIDNDAGYSKENCKWATYADQAKNTRRTRLITANGETLCISDWADRLGASESTIRCRIDRFNWSPIDAVSKPIRRIGRS